VVKVLPRGWKLTIQYDIDNSLPEICTLHLAGDRRKLVVHAVNAKPHVSTRVKQYMEDHSLRMAPHPPYSADRVPSDFFLFGYVKKMLQGSEFQSVEELLEVIVRILNAIPTDILIGIFHDWIKKLKACIDNDG
jgi:hypothetical protein